MLSRFFIDRPIFASVVSLIIVIAGLVCVNVLPITQYPEITPPTVRVSANYPGANAKTVAETVADPIEREVNGVENMIYMSSTSAGDGSYRLTVTFRVGTDLDMASVMVQNRVALALPRLPEEVSRLGVSTKKQSTNIILLITLTSDNPEHDEIFLSNYASLNLRDELARVDGVGDVMIFGGSDYSMRIWLDPNKLEALNLTTNDVVEALRDQNVQVAAGQIGQEPAPKGQNFQYTINTSGRLTDRTQFENIILRTAGRTRITRLKDVARVELGAQNYTTFAEKGGRSTACIAIYQLPGANALNVSDMVHAKMQQLAVDFPAGMNHDIPFDTTQFIRASINEVLVTLVIAMVLVFLTIFVFLQNWRATLIPAIAIPVSLIGTFVFMMAFGFSINLITLFGLILAIGIVVDDAIVIVENTTRHMIDNGLSPRAAAITCMKEMTGPVIATSLVLLAVFVPSAFLPGVTGELYRQFALTIAAATIISTINALTLSPTLCALLLKPPSAKPDVVTRIVNLLLGWFFHLFNLIFRRSETGYSWVAGHVIRRLAIMMVLFLVLAIGAGWGFVSLPTGFLPIEDQGYLIASIQLPDAASLQRTHEMTDKMNDVLRNTPGVEDWVIIGGFSVLDGTMSPNAAAAWIVMKPWDQRSRDQNLRTILTHLRREFAQIQEGVVFTFPPPAIMGLGTAGGFQMQVQAKGGVGLDELQQTTYEMIAVGQTQSGLQALNTTFSANVPQLFADIDREEAKRLDVPLSAVFNTLQTYLGSLYVNDFSAFGRSFQVTAQADSQFRVTPEDIQRLYVRNTQGEPVPLGAIVKVKEDFGPQVITRYQLYPSAAINGAAAQGRSSGEALDLMEQLAADVLPPSMSFEWTGMAFQERQVGSEAIFLFMLAVLMVYLVLAAQYESLTNPMAVILAVPLALLGTVAAVAARGMDNNVYTQIGIVLLIALASKNAILIVEFARENRAAGKGIGAAVHEAARLRFRPILMTSFASLLGFLPLIIASGPGAASRQALGTAVLGGMLAATFLTILFVPTFFVVFQRLAERFSKRLTAVTTVGGDDAAVLSETSSGKSPKDTQIMPGVAPEKPATETQIMKIELPRNEQDGT